MSDIPPVSANAPDVDLSETEADETTAEQEVDDKSTTTGFTFNGGAASNSNVGQLTFNGNFEGVTVNGDAGGQQIVVGGRNPDGTFNEASLTNATIDAGGGNDAFYSTANASVADTELLGGDGADTFVQAEGSTWTNVDVRGEDGSDTSQLAGINDNTDIDLGENGEVPDHMLFGDTVRGDITIADQEHWTYKPKTEESKNQDVTSFYGDWNETEDGFEIAGGGATVTIDGDSDNLELIQEFDPETNEITETFQERDPEIIYDNMWAKITGDVLSTVGTALMFTGVGTIPGVLVASAGAGFKAAFEMDNNIASWGTTGVNFGLSLVPAGKGAGTVANVVRGGVQTGQAIAAGDEAGIAFGLASFAPAGSVKDTLTTVGYTGRGIEAIDAGRPFDVALSVGGAAAGAGFIEVGGTADDIVQVVGHAGNAGTAVANDDYTGLVSNLVQLPNAIGVDDGRVVQEIGNYLTPGVSLIETGIDRGLPAATGQLPGLTGGFFVGQQQLAQDRTSDAYDAAAPTSSTSLPAFVPFDAEQDAEATLQPFAPSGSGTPSTPDPADQPSGDAWGLGDGELEFRSLVPPT